ncbi:hypothetical protein FKM82_019720 [Ascaphus truei]
MDCICRTKSKRITHFRRVCNMEKKQEDTMLKDHTKNPHMDCGAKAKKYTESRTALHQVRERIYNYRHTCSSIRNMKMIRYRPTQSNLSSQTNYTFITNSTSIGGLSLTIVFFCFAP